MNLATLHSELEAHGVTVCVHEGNIELTFGNTPPPAHLIEQLKGHKAAFISYLQQKRARTDTTLFEDQYHYPQSHAQKRIWLADQVSGAGNAYNINDLIPLPADIDQDRLKIALKQLIARHDSLRTRFKEINGSLRQYMVSPTESFSFVETDLNPKEGDKAINECIEREFAYHFDLGSEPLIRFLYVTMGSRKALLVNMHHIIIDGFSVELLKKQLRELYLSGIALPPLKRQYKDFTLQFLTSQKFAQSKAFWRQQLEQVGQMPLLIPIKNRPPNKTFNGMLMTRQLPEDINRWLNRVIQSSQSSPFVVLLATIYLFYYRKTGQQQLVLGTPSLGRTPAAMEDQIGFYINTLPLVLKLEPDMTFQQLIGKAREASLMAIENQQYPFDLMVEDNLKSWPSSRNPFFDCLVAHHNRKQWDAQAQDTGINQGGTAANQEVPGSAKYDLTFDFIEEADSLQLLITYNIELYRSEQISELFTDYIDMLLALMKDEEAPLKDLVMATGPKALCEGPSLKALPFTSLNALWESKKELEKTFITTNTCNLSYSDFQSLVLEKKVALDQEGVQRGDRILLRMNMSPEYLALLFAIWQAGARAVPAGTDLPEERLDLIKADCQPVLQIGTHWQKLSSSRTAAPSEVDDTAIILYTSGSTGKPNGVQLSHKNLLETLAGEQQLYQFTGDLRTCTVTKPYFDVSLLEWGLALIAGGSIYMPDQASLSDPDLLVAQLQSHEVTDLQATPSYIRSLLPAFKSLQESGALQRLFVGGESLPASLFNEIKAAFPQLTINNHYGPTETTIDCICKAAVEVVDVNNIGRPMPGVSVAIVDEQELLCEEGQEGHLFISGAGLSKGYLNRDALNLERFVQLPDLAEKTFYRTGDRARLLPSGEIEFLGRLDQQVKIRGYRVELEEVEKAMASLKEIDTAIVLASANRAQQKTLIGFYTGKPFTHENLVDALSRKLPQYMIPSSFKHLEELPLTPTGKVDRQSLSRQCAAENDKPGEFTLTEKLLKEVWESSLDTAVYSPEDNFFDLGGNSLVAIRTTRQYFDLTGQSLSIKALFQYPSIRQLAEFVEQGASEDSQLMKLTAVEAHKTTLYMIPPIMGSGTVFSALAARLSRLFNCITFVSHSFGQAPPYWEESIEQMAAQFLEEIEDHDDLLLFGYSMGGLVAYEMAKLLEAKGKACRLIIIDRPPKLDQSPAPLKLEDEFELYQAEYLSSVPEEKVAQFRSLFLHHVHLMDQYRSAGSLQSDIHLIHTGKTTRLQRTWQRFTTGALNEETVAANHFSILNHPGLADAITAFGKVEVPESFTTN